MLYRTGWWALFSEVLTLHISARQEIEEAIRKKRVWPELTPEQYAKL